MMFNHYHYSPLAGSQKSERTSSMYAGLHPLGDEHKASHRILSLFKWTGAITAVNDLRRTRMARVKDTFTFLHHSSNNIILTISLVLTLMTTSSLGSPVPCICATMVASPAHSLIFMGSIVALRARWRPSSMITARAWITSSAVVIIRPSLNEVVSVITFPSWQWWLPCGQSHFPFPHATALMLVIPVGWKIDRIWPAEIIG